MPIQHADVWLATSEATRINAGHQYGLRKTNTKRSLLGKLTKRNIMQLLLFYWFQTTEIHNITMDYILHTIQKTKHMTDKPIGQKIKLFYTAYVGLHTALNISFIVTRCA